MSDYPIIPEMPDPPIRNEAPADFSRKASVFLGFLPSLRTAINDAGAWIQAALGTTLGYKQDAEQAVLDAQEQVTLAQGYANNAQGFANAASDKADEALSWAANSQTFADMAAATAAFQGGWSELSGPLNIPATVYHSGGYWQLLRSIPDVETSEPGVSADWVSPDAQGVVAWTPISGNATLAANVHYAVLFSGAGQVLTLPPSPDANDTVYIANRGGNSVGAILARNGSTIMDLPEDVTIDEQITGLRLIYLSGSWRFVQ